MHLGVVASVLLPCIAVLVGTAMLVGLVVWVASEETRGRMDVDVTKWEGCYKALASRFEIDTELADQLREAWSEADQEDNPGEFYHAVCAWFEDGTSPYFDCWLLSSAQLADVYEAGYAEGYADGADGVEQDPQSAIEYVAARRMR